MTMIVVIHVRKAKHLLSCSQDGSVLLSRFLQVISGALVQACSWFCCSSKQAEEKAEIIKVQGNTNILVIKPISYLCDTLLAHE